MDVIKEVSFDFGDSFMGSVIKVDIFDFNKM